MMVEQSELQDHTEFEISGYLQKKTSKGFYVNRYFSTFGHTLRYWQDKAAFNNHEKSSEVYDICDIKNIEKISSRQFALYFLNDKFRLDIKAASDEQCREWMEVLAAKKSMYSVDELLASMDSSRMSFKTNTFRALLVLKEKDQNKYILDRLDDIFTAPSREMQSGKTVIDSSALIRAARTAVEELLTNCEECMLEMSQRNPQVTVHCRTYIRRYAEIVKGRLTLELLFLPGTQDKQFENMGEKCICAAIELMTRVDELAQYSFIPHDLVATLNNTLFTTGQLISSLLNLAINRVDAFVDSVNHLQPSLRPSKFLEIDRILAESMAGVDINLPTPTLLRLVLLKLVTSQMLAFTDHVTVLDFSQYEESALIFHVNTCDILLARFKTTYISLEHRKLVHKIKPDMDVTDGSLFLLFPPAVVDALNSACFISSRNAVLQTVENMTATMGDLTAGLLHEKVVGWIGGDLCAAFVCRLDQWVMHLSSILPAKYSNILFVEVGRLMVHLYVAYMVRSYHDNKYIKLSARGAQQLIEDLRAMHTWLLAHIPAQDSAQDEKDLLLTICDFLTCTQDNALQYFAKAVQKFGIGYSLHLYDIIRLVMKFRIDFSAKTRKAVLGLCGEYLSQLQKATSSDTDLLSGSTNRRAQYHSNSILDLLCPRVGVEHCTGKKWSVEQLADPLPVRLTVAMLVTSTCTETRSTKNRARSPSCSEETEKEGEHCPAAKQQEGVGGMEIEPVEYESDAECVMRARKDAAELPEAMHVEKSMSPTNQSLLRRVPSSVPSSAEQLKKVTVNKKPKPLPGTISTARDSPAGSSDEASPLVSSPVSGSKSPPPPPPQEGKTTPKIVLKPPPPPPKTAKPSTLSTAPVLKDPAASSRDTNAMAAVEAVSSKSTIATTDYGHIVSLSSESEDTQTSGSSRYTNSNRNSYRDSANLSRLDHIPEHPPEEEVVINISYRGSDSDLSQRNSEIENGENAEDYTRAANTAINAHIGASSSSSDTHHINLGRRPLPKTPSPQQKGEEEPSSHTHRAKVNSVRFSLDVDKEEREREARANNALIVGLKSRPLPPPPPPLLVNAQRINHSGDSGDDDCRLSPESLPAAPLVELLSIDEVRDGAEKEISPTNASLSVRLLSKPLSNSNSNSPMARGNAPAATGGAAPHPPLQKRFSIADIVSAREAARAEAAAEEERYRGAGETAGLATGVASFSNNVDKSSDSCATSQSSTAAAVNKPPALVKAPPLPPTTKPPPPAKPLKRPSVVGASDSSNANNSGTSHSPVMMPTGATSPAAVEANVPKQTVSPVPTVPSAPSPTVGSPVLSQKEAFQLLLNRAKEDATKSIIENHHKQVKKK